MSPSIWELQWVGDSLCGQEGSWLYASGQLDQVLGLRLCRLPQGAGCAPQCSVWWVQGGSLCAHSVGQGDRTPPSQQSLLELEPAELGSGGGLWALAANATAGARVVHAVWRHQLGGWILELR